MCLYSYHACFILSLKWEKRVTERNKRLSLWSLFIDEENQFLIPADWIIENDFCRILPGSWGFESFFVACFTQNSKITLTCPKWVKKPNRVNFDFPKVSRININFELSKVSKTSSLKIYISPVTEKLEISNLDTW